MSWSEVNQYELMMSKCEAIRDLSDVTGRPCLFDGAADESRIKEHVEYIFGCGNPTARELDIDDYDWEFEWVDVDEINCDSVTHPEERNVALYERRQAVERTQLSAGHGKPLIVEGEDNVLIEGYTRYHLLKDRYNKEKIPVYRAEAPEQDSRKPLVA